MGKILLLNDDDKARKQISNQLSNAGHDVESALEPFSIIDKIKKTKPDLIIIDNNLGCVDGLSFIEKLNCDQQIPEVPILLTTCGNDILTLIDSIEKGASDYLPLPVTEERLRNRVNTILSRSKG